MVGITALKVLLIQLKVKIFGEGKLSAKPDDENIKISKGVKVG